MQITQLTIHLIVFTLCGIGIFIGINGKALLTIKYLKYRDGEKYKGIWEIIWSGGKYRFYGLVSWWLPLKYVAKPKTEEEKQMVRHADTFMIIAYISLACFVVYLMFGFE